jgi:hypothetical protein
VYGIWSSVSKRFLFGIRAETKQEALRLLREHIGYDSLKYRFRAKRIPNNEGNI